ncbi:transmembrane protein [Ceratobasidium sp. AG-Ba]|nr:transmembrane protein [Ceratobasidium sp. AG-Ba]
MVNNLDESIHYLGFNWRITYDNPSQYAYFQGSVHATSTPGDRCVFTFNGTAVWFFSTYQPGNAWVTINVDGFPTERIDTAPTKDTGLRTQRLIWSKADLSPGSHVVTITHDGVAGDNMTIDFLKYLPNDAEIRSTGSNGRKKLSSGAVVGIVFSVLVFILILVVCRWYMIWHREMLRQKRRESQRPILINNSYYVAHAEALPTEDY